MELHISDNILRDHVHKIANAQHPNASLAFTYMILLRIGTQCGCADSYTYACSICEQIPACIDFYWSRCVAVRHQFSYNLKLCECCHGGGVDAAAQICYRGSVAILTVRSMTSVVDIHTQILAYVYALVTADVVALVNSVTDS